MMAKLDRYHGMATGVFTGDECLAGLDPAQGTELCAVVEYMYSLEHLLSLLGDPAFGDRLEQIAFNALPATFSPDMWGHQYDQQVNQIECSVQAAQLEHQRAGVQHLRAGAQLRLLHGEPEPGLAQVRRAPVDAHSSRAMGLAAVAYAPSEVTATLQGRDGARAAGDGLPVRRHAALHRATAMSPVTFPLLLRIPRWADEAHVDVGGETQPALPGKFHRIEREWRDGDMATLTLPMRPRGAHAAAPDGGHLARAAALCAADGRGVAPHPRGHAAPGAAARRLGSVRHDAVELRAGRGLCAAGAVAHIRTARHAGICPLRRRMRRSLRRCMAAACPNGRRRTTQPRDGRAATRSSTEPLEELTLIPYGCTNLRIAEFPVLDEGT